MNKAMKNVQETKNRIKLIFMFVDKVCKHESQTKCSEMKMLEKVNNKRSP